MGTGLYLAAAIAALSAAIAVLARRLRQSPPILLVIAGAAISLTPGAPSVVLQPDTVLLMFLPPVLYYAAFGMSWQAFRANLRPIVLLAVGCVFATSLAVAAAAHFLLGLSWSLGFLIGALVSPPDVVAPLAIARRLGLPKRLTDILEGEGLVNDATALVLFSFALGAVTTGEVSYPRALEIFSAVVVGETLYGLALGWLMLRLRYIAKDPRAEITLSLLTPFLAFWLPHHLGGSGVLATVVSGLYVGWKGVELIRSETRLQALFFWDFINYLIEGALFLLTGLQAKLVLPHLDGEAWRALLAAAAVVSAVVILVRFAWIFPATYLPRWLWRRLRERDPAPRWQMPFALSFTGVRGVVSLAAALSIPQTLSSGAPFPQRALVLFLTFAVIIVTLVAQGLTLPAVMRSLGLVELGRQERERQHALEMQARAETARAALRHLDQTCRAHGLPPELIQPLRAHHEGRVRRLEGERTGDGPATEASRKIQQIELDLIAAERARLNELVRDGLIGDDIRRRIERDLDLEEQHGRGARASE